jgi:hypothetical protein
VAFHSSLDDTNASITPGYNSVTAYPLQQVQVLTFRNCFGFPSW